MVIFLVLALLGFVASVAVHLSTFLGSHPVGMSQAWPLHVGMFVALLPVIAGDQRGRAEGGENGRPSNGPVSHVPRWMRPVLGVCVVYGLAFFALFIASGLLLPRDGKIVTDEGRPVLMGHGRVVRTLSDGEYRADEARQVRACSAFWMIVYAAAIAGVYEGLARRREARAALPAFPALPSAIRHANPYERAPAPGMSPWAHATIGSILSLVGFFALPMTVGTLFLLGLPPGAGGWWIFLVAPPFFLAAAVGMKLPGILMSRYVPAACPACGGRAYANGPVLGGGGEGVLRYTCRDCGRVCGGDGGVMGPEGGPGDEYVRGSQMAS